MSKRYTGPLTVGMLMGKLDGKGRVIPGYEIEINAYHLTAAMRDIESTRRGWLPVEGPLEAWFVERWGDMIGKTAEDVAGWSPFAEDGP